MKGSSSQVRAPKGQEGREGVALPGENTQYTKIEGRKTGLGRLLTLVLDVHPTWTDKTLSRDRDSQV